MYLLCISVMVLFLLASPVMAEDVRIGSLSAIKDKISQYRQLKKDLQDLQVGVQKEIEGLREISREIGVVLGEGLGHEGDITVITEIPADPGLSLMEIEKKISEVNPQRSSSPLKGSQGEGSITNLAWGSEASLVWFEVYTAPSQSPQSRGVVPARDYLTSIAGETPKRYAVEPGSAIRVGEVVVVILEGPQVLLDKSAYRVNAGELFSTGAHLLRFLPPPMDKKKGPEPSASREKNPPGELVRVAPSNLSEEKEEPKP